MKIIGPDSLVFGVDDLDGCSRFLLDYGLKRVEGGSSGVRTSGMCVLIAPTLPRAPAR